MQLLRIKGNIKLEVPFVEFLPLRCVTFKNRVEIDNGCQVACDQSNLLQGTIEFVTDDLVSNQMGQN